MDDLFLQVLNMSITSSYVILFVILIRFLLKKAPKIYSYSLWSVVLLRLVFPFSFESIFSLISINPKAIPADIIYSQTPQINSGIGVIDNVVNNSLPAATTTASINPMQVWLFIGQVIWLVGIAALILYSIVTTIKLSKRLKLSTHVSDNIYKIDHIKTPFVFGLIKPKIYLPVDLSQNEKTYIIKHEQTHIERYDHIIKFIAFIVVSIHWFNPLVWLGFILMSKDMELSCDEKVIKELGNEIKKDYSKSLLSLSLGRRIIGGSPLAFGENNTKGRIKNILNYKKPKFWVTIVGILVLIISAVGLLSNSKEEIPSNNVNADTMTVEDYAKEFIEEQILIYEDPEGAWEGFKIIDSKIIKLEKLETFDNILANPIEVWSLEFRLKPDDISKVAMAGGMREEDGWITDDSSMGKPFLAFSKEENSIKHLGSFYQQEFGSDTLAKQEINLRIMLENNGLLENESYKGNHVVIRFPMSSGELGQLLLSQPIIQGSKGIWVVERWRDGSGNSYYVFPNTDIKIEDYYKNEQEEFDNGEDLSLGDPIEVGYDYITNHIGKSSVNKSDLLIINPATIDDFKDKIYMQRDQGEYYFNPSLSIIEGRLITRMHYGPPGYGENPDTDSQEHPFIIQLEEPINVLALDGDIYNGDKLDVTEIQLVPKTEENYELVKQYINKPIKIQGTLFEALTGHHHTDVLIDVEKVLD